VRAAAHSEVLIRKSRFIGCVQPASGRAQAQAVVQALRQAHPGAAHVCWALLAGGQSAAVDDGEPGGTAGRPMLDVLRLQNLDGVLATVVRYFGGIKLGAGGLVRAYSETIAQAVRNADKMVLQPMQDLHCTVPYAREDWARRCIKSAGAELLRAEHAALVHLHIRLPKTQVPAFMAYLDDGGQGAVGWMASLGNAE